MNLPQVGKALAVAALAAFATSNAFAANDGIMGPNSHGDLTIRLTINALARISHLDDIDLGGYDGSADMPGTDDLCVYSNTGAYQITATGDGAGSAFHLTGPASATVPYTVEWADAAGAGAGTALTPGAALTGQSGTITTPNCNGGDNARVTVTANSTDLAPAPAGAYVGVLTLVVAPE